MCVWVGGCVNGCVDKCGYAVRSFVRTAKDCVYLVLLQASKGARVKITGLGRTGGGAKGSETETETKAKPVPPSYEQI